MATRYCTPSLWLGGPPPGLAHRAVQVETATGAVKVIDGGRIAVLPFGAHEMAGEVLTALGADEPTRRPGASDSDTGLSASVSP